MIQRSARNGTPLDLLGFRAAPAGIAGNPITWTDAILINTSAQSLLQIANDAGSCTAAKLGRLRYNGTSTWEYCDGTTWTAFGGGGGAVGADTLDFTELMDAMALDASTDVSAPSGQSYVFSLTNLGTGNSFVVNDAASDTTPFVIDASGSVGIGTASPSGKMDISGNLFVSPTTAGAWDEGIIINPSTIGGYGGVFLRNTAGSTSGTWFIGKESAMRPAPRQTSSCVK